MPYFNPQHWEPQDLKFDPTKAWQEGKKDALSLALQEYKRQEQSARAPHFGELAETEVRGKKAHAYAEEAMAGLHGAHAQKAIMQNRMLQQAMQHYTDQGQGEGEGEEPQEQTTYGIPNTKPTLEDYKNSQVFGENTFQKRQEAAVKNQQEQKDLFKNDAIASSNQVLQDKDALATMQKISDLRSKTHLTGSLGGHLAGQFASSEAQDIDALHNKLVSPGISTMANLVGGHATNPAINVAISQKPQRTWNDKTFKMYRETAEMGFHRNEQKAEFDAYTHSHPRLGLTNAEAKIAWNAFQTDYPVISSDGKRYLDRNVQGDNWKRYLTPEAVKDIKETGHISKKTAKDAAVSKALGDNRQVMYQGGVHKRENGVWMEPYESEE